MQNGVLFLSTLVTNVPRDARFVTKFANRIHKKSIRPKFTTPKLLLHFRVLLKNLSRCDTLQNSDDLCRTQLWNRLNQKMNVILVCANFQKM